MATAKAAAKELSVSEKFHSTRLEFVATILGQKKIADPKSPEIVKAYKICEKHLEAMQDLSTKEGKFDAWVRKAQRMMKNFEHNAEYKRVEKKLAKEKAKAEKAKEAPKVASKAKSK